MDGEMEEDLEVERTEEEETGELAAEEEEYTHALPHGALFEVRRLATSVSG
jgi:hypothetical protein